MTGARGISARPGRAGRAPSPEHGAHAPVLAGILVGGQARRFGGLPKGLLRGPRGTSLLQGLVDSLRELEIPYVLVGRHPAYRACNAPALDDERLGIGPMGGLLSLLRHAGSRDAIALACDLPFVSSALLQRLATASPGAAAVAPRRNGRWEPLFARYAARRALPVAEARAASGDGSLQRMLENLDTGELSLQPEEHALLDDWDSPGDMLRR